MEFIKMHAAGNDYVYVDGDKYDNFDFSQLATKICHRRFGVGGDGIITVKRDKSLKGDFFMRIFNADGSEGNTCGNGLRCAAVFAFLTQKTANQTITVRTLSAVHTVTLKKTGNSFFATADFPLPKLIDDDYAKNEIIRRLNLSTNDKFCIADCGNRHAVFFNVARSAVDIASKISTTNVFKDGINVESARTSETEIECDVFERGSGTTLSCGSGAVATAFAAKTILRFNLPKYPISMRGGTLFVSFDNEKCYLSGEVTPVFYGKTVKEKLYEI